MAGTQEAPRQVATSPSADYQASRYEETARFAWAIREAEVQRIPERMSPEEFQAGERRYAAALFRDLGEGCELMAKTAGQAVRTARENYAEAKSYDPALGLRRERNFFRGMRTAKKHLAKAVGAEVQSDYLVGCLCEIVGDERPNMDEVQVAMAVTARVLTYASVGAAR